MKPSKSITCIVIALLLSFGMVGCAKTKQPDFSGYTKIAELATLECTLHNVAEIYNDGTDILFGLKVGYKKAWFEYDGKVNLGVDVSKVKITGPDGNGVVTIAVPNAQVLGLPDADESTFSDIYSDTSLFTPIEGADQAQAYQKAQEEMKKTAESNSELLSQAKKRAEVLLGQYVKNVGEAIGQNYEIKFVDAE